MTIFKVEKTPKDWTALTCGADLAFGEAGKLQANGSYLQAATRVETPEDREAVVGLTVDGGKSTAKIDITVWINDTVVFKLGADKSLRQEPFRLREAGNTMLVECRSAEGVAVSPGVISLKFNDAKTGQALDELLFDVEGRP